MPNIICRRPSRSCQGIHQNTHRSFASGHLILPTASAFICDLAGNITKVCLGDGPHSNTGEVRELAKFCKNVRHFQNPLVEEQLDLLLIPMQGGPELSLTYSCFPKLLTN